MPRYVSDEGRWKPGKERVAITNAKGEPEIYDGDDRAALEEIKAGNVTSQHFTEFPEFIDRVRQVRNLSVKEYLDSIGYNPSMSKAEVEKRLSEVNTYSEPERKKQEHQRSGGSNTAGATGHQSGDFGEPKIK